MTKPNIKILVGDDADCELRLADMRDLPELAEDIAARRWSV
jgi:hypothetical protein